MTEHNWLPRWVTPVLIEDFVLAFCSDKRHGGQNAGGFDGRWLWKVVLMEGGLDGRWS
jgi:hypothetical protein